MKRRRPAALRPFLAGGLAALLLLGCAVVPPAYAEAEAAAPRPAIYVATDGNDLSGSGSVGSPYATVNRALDDAVPGDVIILRGGTYENQGEIKIETANITIRSADNERAYVRAPYDDEDISFCFWFTQEASGGTLTGLDISGGNYYAVKFDSDWDWDRSVPYDMRSGASDMRISDCVLHDCGADIIKITPGCDDVVIERCELYNSGRIITDNAEGVDNVNGDRMIVRDCTIHDIATNGVYCKGGATGCVVESTVVERCGEGGIFLGFDTSPEWFDLDANPGYYEAVGCGVYNCIIRDTALAGIALYASDGCRVCNNTLIDTAQAGHAPLYFGVTYQDWEPEAGRPANRNPVICNNIVCQYRALGTPAILIRYADDLGGLSGLDGDAEIDYNCYYFADGSVYFEDNRPGAAFSGDLAGWRAHMGTDAHSIIADPMLDSASRLTGESPCVDRGLRIADIGADIDGDLRQGLPDIGADEYALPPP